VTFTIDEAAVLLGFLRLTADGLLPELRALSERLVDRIQSRLHAAVQRNGEWPPMTTSASASAAVVEAIRLARLLQSSLDEAARVVTEIETATTTDVRPLVPIARAEAVVASLQTRIADLTAPGGPRGR
jgi:hypothetical protein